MARETAQQKAERLAQEETAARAALEEYRKTVPARLAAAEKLAREVGVSVKLSLTEIGPYVEFYDRESALNYTANYQIDQWELEQIECVLAHLKREQDAAAARRRLAEEVWARLAPEERQAVKENMVYLRA